MPPSPTWPSLRVLKSAFPSDHIGMLLFTHRGHRARRHRLQPDVRAGLGVAEDPATGSAAGPLGCYLVSHGLVKGADAAQKIVNWQGVRMGRPSRIHIAITSDAAGRHHARAGRGQSVLVAEGTLTL